MAVRKTRKMVKSAKPVAPTGPRVVKSLHMPLPTYEAIAKAARKAGETFGAFVRTAAEERAGALNAPGEAVAA